MTAGDDPISGDGFATLSVAAILAENSWRNPDKLAFIWAGNDGPDARVTYGELWQQTRAYAGALRAKGIGRGDRVAMMIPNVPDFARVYYAVLALGAVAVPIHLLFKAEEIGHILADSGAKLLVVGATSLGEALPAAAGADVPALTVLVPDAQKDVVPVPRLADLAADARPIERYEAMRPMDAATLLYTSGTTGSPKGAVNSHFSLVENVNVSLLDQFPLTRDDVMFGGLPLFHTFGQTCVLNTGFRRGATIVLLPKFEPAAALAAMVEHEVTVFSAVPTMYVALLSAAAAGGAVPKLRYAVSGGAPLPLAVLEAFERVFDAKVHEGYGLTETSPVASFNIVGEEIHPGTVGVAIWGTDVAVADPDVDDRIELLPDGELGEIVIRGHNLFKGYLGLPDATREAVVDGWFRTGDLGRVEDRLITIVDRKKDMIVRNGYNVYPTEVEGVLVRHPSVHTAAVFGVPHPVHGQEIAAAIVLEAGAEPDAEAIRAFVEAHLAAYKFPREVYFVDELPLGPSGKVLKRELTRTYAEPAAQPA